MKEVISRRQREHQQHIRHILDAAAEVFAERGFFHTTMRQISQRAEFALGTIYAYFGSKKRLYTRIMEARVNEMVATVSASLTQSGNPEDQILSFISSKMHFLQRNLPFLRFLIGAINSPANDHNHIFPQEIRNKYNHMLKTLTAVIQQGIDKGTFRQMQPDVLAKVLDNLTNTFALLSINSKEPSSLETNIYMIRELFLYGAYHVVKGE